MKLRPIQCSRTDNVDLPFTYLLNMNNIRNAEANDKCYAIQLTIGTRTHGHGIPLTQLQHSQVRFKNSNVANAYRLLFCSINPLNPELNPICYLLALLGAHHFLHVSRIRVKSLTFRRLMSYIHGAPILDVSRSHTTTQHSR